MESIPRDTRYGRDFRRSTTSAGGVSSFPRDLILSVFPSFIMSCGINASRSGHVCGVVSFGPEWIMGRDTTRISIYEGRFTVGYSAKCIGLEPPKTVVWFKIFMMMVRLTPSRPYELI
jgi:hypothetical protein